MEGSLEAPKSKETYLSSRHNHMKDWKKKVTPFVRAAEKMVSSRDSLVFLDKKGNKIGVYDTSSFPNGRL